MRTRTSAALAVLLLSGCTWGRSKPENCTRFMANEGIGRLVQIASASGVEGVKVEHSLCGKRERLEGLARVRADEVGSCAVIGEELPVSAEAIRMSVGRWCDEAVRRQVRYAHWDSVVADQFLFVSEFRTIEQPLFPPGAGPNR